MLRILYNYGGFLATKIEMFGNPDRGSRWTSSVITPPQNPYGTLRTGDIEDSDVEDKTLRTGDVEDRATLRTGDVEDKHYNFMNVFPECLSCGFEDRR